MKYERADEYIVPGIHSCTDSITRLNFIFCKIKDMLPHELEFHFQDLKNYSDIRKGIFGFPDAQENEHDELEALIKYKFWIKMSLGYAYNNKNPINNASSSDSQDTKQHYINLLNTENPINLISFKQYLIDSLISIDETDQIVKNINACMDEKQLLELFRSNKTIRDTSIRDCTNLLFIKKKVKPFLPNISGTQTNKTDSEKHVISDDRNTIQNLTTPSPSTIKRGKKGRR